MMYNTKKLKCPCCGNYYDAVDCGDDRFIGIGEICPICFWQYDILGEERETIAVGPNKVSLIEARENYIKIGAKEERLLPYVRKPRLDELPENNE
jgi:hypothetical protein